MDLRRPTGPNFRTARRALAGGTVAALALLTGCDGKSPEAFEATTVTTTASSNVPEVAAVPTPTTAAAERRAGITTVVTTGPSTAVRVAPPTSMREWVGPEIPPASLTDRLHSEAHLNVLAVLPLRDIDGGYTPQAMVSGEDKAIRCVYSGSIITNAGPAGNQIGLELENPKGGKWQVTEPPLGRFLMDICASPAFVPPALVQQYTTPSAPRR